MSSSYTQDPTPLENFSGGCGCGCGCLGLLASALGLAALGAIPLGLYAQGPGYMAVVGGISLVLGITSGALGVLLIALGTMAREIRENPEQP